MKKWDFIKVKDVSDLPKEWEKLSGKKLVAEYCELPHLKFFGYKFKFSNETYITPIERVEILERNIMRFESRDDVKTYFNKYREENKGARNLNYPVPAKKALVEFMQRYDVRSSSCARDAGVSKFSINHWKDQHKKGLYENMDAVTKVSMKTKKSHSSAVEHLKELKEKLKRDYVQEVMNIDIQISTIKHLEEKGYTITKAA